MSEVLVTFGGRRYSADLSDPLSLAMPLDFDGVQPNCFGAPTAHARPLQDGEFVGDVRAGGSVNCEALALAPHCNGTHTECVGHLTSDRIAVHEVLRGGLFITRLVSVRPESAAAAGETPDADAATDEPVVTARALGLALAALPGPAKALVIRTLPNDASKLSRRYQGAAPAAYLTAEAAMLLVEHEVRHLVVDLPSIDRAHDRGRLVAHRIFFGLAGESRRAHDATRREATVTELAWIAPTIHDGWYLLDLQLPAFMSDAAPSRPLLYPARAHD